MLFFSDSKTKIQNEQLKKLLQQTQQTPGAAGDFCTLAAPEV